MQAFLVAIFLFAVAITDEMGAYLKELNDIVSSFESEIQDLRYEVETITESSLFDTSYIQTHIKLLDEQIILAKRVSEELAQPRVTSDRLLAISTRRPIFVPLVVGEQYARRTEGLAEFLNKDKSSIGDLAPPPSRIESVASGFWLMMNDSSWNTTTEGILQIIKSTYGDVSHWDEIGSHQVEAIKRQAQQVADAYLSRISYYRSRWQDVFSKLRPNKVKIPVINLEADPKYLSLGGLTMVFVLLLISILIRYRGLQLYKSCSLQYPFAWFPELGGLTWRVLLGYPWLAMPLFIAGLASAALMGVEWRFGLAASGVVFLAYLAISSVIVKQINVRNIQSQNG